MDTGKRSTCLVMGGLGLCMHVYVALVFDRGTIIPFPVTADEHRVRFLLCELCPLTCRHHADTISSVHFPLGQGNYPVCLVLLTEEVGEIV